MRPTNQRAGQTECEHAPGRLDRFNNIRAARFLKAELKRADVTYEELAARMKKHCVQEIRDSISAELKRGTFPATFLIAALVAIGCEVVRLEDI
ncbi:MAG TPA: DUF6471 domain-containing protein [Xanthobacteraceae bacterium]|nr:DUF6471 domain-containing protein [Xanthobacteraceae bacterium]